MKILIASFTVFAIFFGAGNLIYPVFVGLETKSSFIYGFLGFSVTGILLPLLGLISMIKVSCDVDKFFSLAGKRTGAILTVIILALLGPFGGIPRCIIVPFEAIQVLNKSISFLYFNIFFCALTFILVIRKKQIVEIIGKCLTPALIAGIIITVIKGILAQSEIPPSTLSEFSSFTFAALEGYQTMDICAAIFFARILLDYFTQESPKGNVLTPSIISSILGFLLLGIVYAAMLFLGAKYATNLNEISKASLFNGLTDVIMGNISSVTVVFTVFFACLTTVIALVQLVSDWVANRFQISFKLATCITITCSMISASFGFQSLTAFLAGVLGVIYPALIVLTLCNIASSHSKYTHKYSPLIFWTITAANACLMMIV